MTRAGVACLGCAEHLDPHASRYRLDLLPDGDSKKQGRAVGYLCCGCERILVKALRRMRSDSARKRTGVVK